MKELLEVVTEFVVPAIDFMALLLIVVGTIEAFVRCVRGIFVRADGHAGRAALLGYGRWLVAGLTFQLAADILETSIRTSWEAIGQLAAIAGAIVSAEQKPALSAAVLFCFLVSTLLTGPYVAWRKKSGVTIPAPA